MRRERRLWIFTDGCIFLKPCRGEQPFRRRGKSAGRAGENPASAGKTRRRPWVFSVFVRSGITTREPEKGKLKFRSDVVRLWQAHQKSAHQGQMFSDSKQPDGGVQIPVHFEQDLQKYNQKYACVPQKSGYNQCQKEQKPLFCVKNGGFPCWKRFSTKWEYRKRLRHIYSGGPAGPAPGRGKRERGAGDFRVRCMKKGWCIHDGQGIQTPLPGGAGGDHL